MNFTKKNLEYGGSVTATFDRLIVIWSVWDFESMCMEWTHARFLKSKFGGQRQRSVPDFFDFRVYGLKPINILR